MNNTEQTLEERRRLAIKAAKEEGIVDVFQASEDGINLEILELATSLMKEHGPQIYKDLAERRKKQV
jgi:hypothetical protein